MATVTFICEKVVYQSGASATPTRDLNSRPATTHQLLQHPCMSTPTEKKSQRKKTSVSIEEICLEILHAV
jgi:hypothetical protein